MQCTKCRFCCSSRQSKVSRWQCFHFCAFTFSFWFCNRWLGTSTDRKKSESEIIYNFKDFCNVEIDASVWNIQDGDGPKKLAPFLSALTLPNINRFSKLFHYQNQEKICNNIIVKDPTTPQVCRYTTLWNASVLKATIENKTTSVTTHFKKVTTGNNVFIVSVIV